MDQCEIVQGTPEWLEWRKQGLGASEVPAVMGESDFETAHGLWLIRTGRRKPKDTTHAMTRGLDLEAKVRALYELETGMDCPPALFTHPDIPWARASLDGWVESRQIEVEMKCMGKEKHALAVAGKVPDTYRAQLQYQLFVTGAKAAHFVSLDPENENSIAIVPVTRDLEYWEKMIPACEAFWKCVQTDTPPPLTERDYKELEGDHLAVFERWKSSKLVTMQLEEAFDQIKKNLKAEQEKLDQAREQIVEIMKAEHPKVRAAGVKAFTVQRKSGPTIDIRLEDSVTA